MRSIVKFLIVLLRSLLLCFCTVLLSEVNTIQCMQTLVAVLDNPLNFGDIIPSFFLYLINSFFNTRESVSSEI